MTFGVCSCNTEDMCGISQQPAIQNELTRIASMESRALSCLGSTGNTRSDSEISDTLVEVPIEDLLYLAKELDSILIKYQDLCTTNQDIASLPEDTLKMMLLDKEIFCNQIQGKVSRECSSMCTKVLVESKPIPTHVIANSNASFNEKVAVQTLSTALEINALSPSSLEVKVQKSCEDELNCNKNYCGWMYFGKSALSILVGIFTVGCTDGASVLGMVKSVADATYDLKECIDKANLTYELCKEKEKNRNRPRQ